MLMNIFNVISAIFIIAGLFFIVVGTIGLLRLPDFYSRMHATGKCDTLGVGLTITGLMIYNGFNFISVELLFLVIFIFIANPVATHAIARAAYKVGLQAWRRQ
ncbi:MAG: monovalent cation/H(+) antiporter subunit G [Candidatus Methanoperedens sp.]|nr:monovalent cation/H(+) antiporter subunit G [Candidatus Methanoperedens sp.]